MTVAAKDIITDLAASSIPTGLHYTATAAKVQTSYLLLQISLHKPLYYKWTGELIYSVLEMISNLTYKKSYSQV